jgi:VanZ family protein
VRKQYLLTIALFWTGIILFFCLIKANDIPVIKIQNFDKVVHVFFHFVFTTLWFLFFRKQFVNFKIRKTLQISFSLSLLFGIAIEIAQSTLTTTRKGDVSDVLANATGALVAVGVLFFYFKEKDTNTI